MHAEMDKVWRTETGGVLVGYLEADTLFVTSASGPGSRAELRMFSVLIDGVHGRDFCSSAFADSHGKVDYVGDWHCHLAFCIRPSAQDHQAMQIMADFKDSPTTTPISLIWSKYTGKVVAYRFTSLRKLRRIPCLINL